MSRSLYKMPYISQTLSKAIKKASITTVWIKKKHSLIKVFSRSSTITPDLIGLQVQIHNGRGFAGLK
jgi:small subunit ribosomal protein S19